MFPSQPEEEFSFEAVTVDRDGRIVATSKCQARRVTVELAAGVALELGAIPGGAFRMGSPDGQGYADEHPQHPVAISPFLMGMHLVTQAQWEAVMGSAPLCRCQGARRPVDNVSWEQAQAFLARLSTGTGRTFRLPSEAEWEYACRAGTTTPFSCGETLTTDLANYNGAFTFAGEPQGPYRHESTVVGSFAPNVFGLCDMHGNLWEWCADAWHGSYRGAPADGTAWDAASAARYRVARGGSWHDTPDVCRSAVRLRVRAAEGDDILGFRVAANWR